MNILCVIPARGGSKRVPRKNILSLNGTPLISYTIRAAKDSGVFDKIIVSTDDAEIKDVAIAEGVDVDDRPEHMAGDKVTKVQVVKEYLERVDCTEFSHVAALLPTCPFRTAQDMVDAVKLYENSNEDFLIGVTEYEFPVQLALHDINDEVVQMDNSENYLTTRSQNIEKRFHPNGSIYLAKIDKFLEKGTFFNEKMAAYKMPAVRSFDIDYPYQFKIAEVLAKLIQDKEI